MGIQQKTIKASSKSIRRQKEKISAAPTKSSPKSGVQLSKAGLKKINGLYRRMENDLLPESFKSIPGKIPERCLSNWADYTQGKPWYKQEKDDGCFFFWDTSRTYVRNGGIFSLDKGCWILRYSTKKENQDLYTIPDDKTAPDFDKVVSVTQKWRPFKTR